jgi:hypothetical protein
MSDTFAAPRAARPWRRLLSEAAAAKALATAEEIAAAIGSPAAQAARAAGDRGAAAGPLPPGAPADPHGFRRPPYLDFSLADGHAGIAVFLSYLEAARPGRGYGEWALGHLERAIAGMGEIETPPQLYSGFPGVAWAVEHLDGRLADAEEDTGEDVARLLAEHLGQSPWRRHFDLTRGAVGLGVYALERARRPYGEECLRRTVARLAEIAEQHEDGITWRSPPGPQTPPAPQAPPGPQAPQAPHDSPPDGIAGYNLGVAHGVPGVIALLGEAVAALDPPAASALLAGAVAWLLAQKLPPGSPSVFPDRVAPGATPAPTRVSWCYGDLGIAIALLGAARRAGRPAWEAEALAVARSTAMRPVDQSGIVDPGLCHGAAGAAHVFNRLFQATGEQVFAEAARGWIERTYALRRAGSGLAGFSAWRSGPSGDFGWHDTAGLLTGAAGVGLALLAAATTTVPAWDRMLLVSVPG